MYSNDKQKLVRQSSLAQATNKNKKANQIKFQHVKAKFRNKFALKHRKSAKGFREKVQR